MGLARQAFNIDATWVNALPSWQSMYICRSQSGPAMTDSSASRFGFVSRCRQVSADLENEPGTMIAVAIGVYQELFLECLQLAQS
jgi:hypothetical protein